VKHRITTSQNLGEVLAIGISSVTIALVLVGTIVSILGNYPAGTSDFIEYWASGKQLLGHGNPYSANDIGNLEHSAGFLKDDPLIMWNPPYALPLTLLPGLFEAKLAHRIWLLMLAFYLLLSIKLVSNMNDRGKTWIPLFACSFGPALICLLVGQMSVLVLLGLVLFLYFNQDHPVFAGASLWLCLLKPQLFVPCMLVMFAWIITTKRYAILVGAIAMLVAATATAYFFDPLVFQHYTQMIHTTRLGLTIPCLSIIFRKIVSPTSVWVQYIPAIAGSLWALNYFRIHRKGWDWKEQGLLLILVSVMVAPYTWLLDQAILIPSLIHGATKTTSPVLIAVLALANTAVCIGVVGSESVLHSLYFVWTAPFWLAWYLFAVRSGGEDTGNPVEITQLDRIAVKETTV
jgi:hypothetical protein